MSGHNILNLCYSSGAKREIITRGEEEPEVIGNPNTKQKHGKKKVREEARYHVLKGESSSPSGASALTESDEDSDSTYARRPTKKMALFSKIFKAKAKNSDDEDGPSSPYELSDIKETGEAHSYRSPDEAFKQDVSIVHNRKKCLSSVDDKKSDHQKKQAGWAKIRPAPDIPIKNTSYEKSTNTDHSAATFIDKIDDQKPINLQPINKERVLKEFDPFWPGGAKKENTDESLQLLDIPTKPPRNKYNEKLIGEDNFSVIELPELKIAKIEALKDQYLSVVKQVPDKPMNNNADKLLVKANISYESAETGLYRPVVNDNIGSLKEGEVRIIASDNNAFGAVAFTQETASGSYSDLQPFLDEACNNPRPKLTDEEERANNKIIADFFSEYARSFTDADVNNFKANIAISKIEIYAEDIKRYHEGLKYHRGPVEHDRIYCLVETALKFIEKATELREQKKKTGFFPNLIERCLKSKAKREAEAKKKKEEKKKKDTSRPKMWLVYNPYQKETLIICTPGDFYDVE